MLIGLLSAYQGRVNVLGCDVRTWDRSYYRRIGVAFEAPNHYLKLTARENLQLFAGLHGGDTEDPDAVLERVGLREDAELCDRVAFLVGGRIAALDSPRSPRLAYGRRVVRIETAVDGRRTEREFLLDGLADSTDFFDLLRSGTVETIHTLETTREDVFVRVTGRTLA